MMHIAKSSHSSLMLFVLILFLGTLATLPQSGNAWSVHHSSIIALKYKFFSNPNIGIVFNQFNYWAYSKGSPFGMLTTYSLSPPYYQGFNFSGPSSLHVYNLHLDLAPSCLLSDCLNMTCFTLTCSPGANKNSYSNSSVSIGNCADNKWNHNITDPGALFMTNSNGIPCQYDPSRNYSVTVSVLCNNQTVSPVTVTSDGCNFVISTASEQACNPSFIHTSFIMIFSSLIFLIPLIGWLVILAFHWNDEDPRGIKTILRAVLERMSIVGRKFQGRLLGLRPEEQDLMTPESNRYRYRKRDYELVESSETGVVSDVNKVRSVFHLTNLRMSKTQISLLQLFLAIAMIPLSVLRPYYEISMRTGTTTIEIGYAHLITCFILAGLSSIFVMFKIDDKVGSFICTSILAVMFNCISVMLPALGYSLTEQKFGIVFMTAWILIVLLNCINWMLAAMIAEVFYLQKPRNRGCGTVGRVPVWLIYIFFGWTGAHRFYTGRVFTGTVYLFTLGCIGFGWLADFFFVDDMIDIRNDFARTPIEFSLKEKAIKKRDMKIAYFLLMVFGAIGLHRFYLGGDATYTATIVAMCATLVSSSWGVFVVLQGQSNFVPLLFLGLFGLVDLCYYLYDFVRIKTLVEQYNADIDMKASDEEKLLLKRIQEPWLIHSSELTVSGELDIGSSSVVYKGKWKDLDVAIKRLSREIDQKSKRKMIKEAEHRLKLVHVNLVRLYGLSVDPMCVITEVMSRRSLHRLLATASSDESDMVIQPKRLLNIALDAATGLCFLHESGVVHQDIKSSHILIGENWTAKLGQTFQKHNREIRSLRWAAPEVVASNGKYQKQSDVWSFGVMLWEIVNRVGKGRYEPPFAGYSDEDVAISIKKGLFPVSLNTEITEHPPTEITNIYSTLLPLISVILVLDIRKRPTCNLIVNHLQYIIANVKL